MRSLSSTFNDNTETIYMLIPSIRKKFQWRNYKDWIGCEGLSELEEEDRETFRSHIQSFIRLYGYISQIITFKDIGLENSSYSSEDSTKNFLEDSYRQSRDSFNHRS